MAAAGARTLPFVDEVDEHVAGLGFGPMCGIDERQVIGRAARRPGARATGPRVERRFGVGGLDRVLALLQARIDEVARDVGDRRIVVMLGKHHGNVEFAQQRYERRRAETVVSHLDDMAQRTAVKRRREEFEEAAEVRFVELFRRRELPQQRPEPCAEFEHAGIEEILDGVAGLREHTAIGREARALDGEDKALGSFACPFAEALRLLRAVVGRIDLDRGQVLAGVGQLFRLRQALGIEHPAPRLEGPAADPCSNLSRFCHALVEPLSHSHVIKQSRRCSRKAPLRTTTMSG